MYTGQPNARRFSRAEAAAPAAGLNRACDPLSDASRPEIL
jgi:hypothetical protein